MQSAECGVKKRNNRNRFNRGERRGRIGRETANGEAGRPESDNKPAALPRDGPAGIGRNLKLAHVVVAACGIKGKAAKEQRVIKESWHNENR